MGNILLVHGACMSGSSWDLVAPPLRERGHQVEAIDLHRGSLAADTAYAQAVADGLGGSVVACGHSYGGMVVTGLTLPLGSQLAYIAAFLPSEGESSGGLMSQWPSDGSSVMTLDKDGQIVLSGDELDAIAWGDATPEQASIGRAAQRSQAVAPAFESPTRFGWRDTPSTYVLCRQDRVVQPALQREMAQRATNLVEWESSHCPNLSHAGDVVDLLDRLATS